MRGWLASMVVAGCLAPASLGHAQSPVPSAALSAPAIDPASAAERDAIRAEREQAWALYASGGILLTAGGFTTFGAFFPGSSIIVLYASLGAALVGLILFVSAVALGTDVHRRADALRARSPSLVAGPGDLGLALALRF